VNLLLYGPPRVGKTVFAGSAGCDPRTAPVLVLDFESGASSLRGTPGDVHVLAINTWEDYNEIYEYLLNGEDVPYKTIVVDSISETHIFSLMGVVEKSVQESDRRQNDLQIEQSDYGKSLLQMRKFLRSFRDLPYNIVFTAISKTEMVPGEGWVQKPFLFGQLADEVVGMFDVVAFLMHKDELESEGKRKRSKKASPSNARVLILDNEPAIRLGTRRPMGVEIPDVIEVGTTDGFTQLLNALQIGDTPNAETTEES
jgi:phage nucleotide-binding protein